MTPKAKLQYLGYDAERQIWHYEASVPSFSNTLIEVHTKDCMELRCSHDDVAHRRLQDILDNYGLDWNIETLNTRHLGD